MATVLRLRRVVRPDSFHSRHRPKYCRGHSTSGRPRRICQRMESGSRVSTVAAIVGALALIGLAVVAGALVTAEPATRTLDGVVTLVEGELAKFDRDVHDGLELGPIPATDAPRLRCSAMGTDALVLPGLPVVAYDEEGEVLGRGLLGQAEPVPVVDSETGRTSMSCRLPFAITAVERKGNVTLEIGARDRRTYTSTELEAADWNIEVRIGQ